VRVLYLKEASIPFDGRTAFTLYDTTASHSTSRRTCAARRASRSTSRPTTPRCRSSAPRRARRRSSRWRRARVLRRQDEFRGYDTLTHVRRWWRFTGKARASMR
jgi:hypothetical protein